MKKNIPLLYLILFVILNITHGQNDIYHLKYEVETNTTTHEYGDAIEFITSNIASDYGKRKVTGNSSRWHRGVDFGIQAPVTRWDHFLSLNTGTIKKLKGGSGYKYIITEGTENNFQHHFGYGHIFDKDAANPTNIKGDLVLAEMDDPYENSYAIIDLTSTENRAFGPQSGTATYNNETYEVTTSIEHDEVLGNIGRSGTSNYGYMHVHVYMFNNIDDAIAFNGHSNVFNDCDPLEFISHENTTYNVEIETDNNVNAQNVVTASGADAISIKVRYTMENAGMIGSKFNSAVMDIDDVDIFIKGSNKPDEDNSQWGNGNSNYQLITGEWVESHLSHGARLSSEIYPVIAAYGHAANPTTNTVINLVGNTYGNFTSTGIDPFAYWDNGNQPYDDYYFSDFYTRVVESYNIGDLFALSINNKDVKYADGSYFLYAKSETVRDNTYTSIDNGENPTEIIIDNFPPYVKKLEIFRGDWIDNDLKYSAEWEWNPGTNTLEFMGNTYTGLISTQNATYHLVVVTFSEEMPLTYMTINGLGIVHQQPLSNNYNDDPNAKIFFIDDDIISNALPGDYTIIIEDAKDLAQTDLFGFHNTNDLLASNYPKRQSNGIWSPAYNIHTDNIHGFTINNWFELQADFSTLDPSIVAGESVSFIDNSTGQLIDEWIWTFEGGSLSTSTDQNPIITYADAGVYDVTLTVYDLFDQTSTVTKLDYIQVDESGITAEFVANVTVIDMGENITFSDLSSANTTTWNWWFQGGDPSSYHFEDPPEITYSNGGNFTVRLVASNQYGDDVEEKIGYIDVADPRPIPEFNTDNGITNIEPENYLDFEDLSTNDPTSWFWEFEGATPSSSTEQHPSNIYYDLLGAYDVTLSTTNEFGTRTITKDGFVLVSNPAVSLEIDCYPEHFIYTVGDEVKFTGMVTNGTPPFTYNFIFNGSQVLAQTTNNQFVIASKVVYNAFDVYDLYISISDNSNPVNNATCTSSVSIQQIGASHNVDFSWTPATPILGEDVTFQNSTSGGAMPYMQSYWQWFEDPNTGYQPVVPSSELLWWDEAMDSPTVDANYDQLGNYPVTLTVSDALGWPVSETKVIHFVPADECIYFEGNYPIGFQHPYPQVGVATLFGSSGFCCYSPDCNVNFPGQEFSVVTNVRWKLFDAVTGEYIQSSTVTKYIEENPYYECDDCYDLTIDGNSDCLNVYDFWGYYVDYTFDTNDDKEYIVQCEIWNKCVGEYMNPNPYTENLTPDQAVSLPYYDVAYRYFRVVDCNNSESYSMNVIGTENPEVWAGYIELGGTTAHTIQSGAEITYVAHHEISLLNDFTAYSGSNFTARIEPCPDYSDAANNDYSEFTVSKDDYFKTGPNNIQTRKQLQVKVLPNPNKGRFKVMLSNIRGSYSLIILDNLGNIILEKRDMKEYVVNVDISNYAKGVYFLKVKTSNNTFVEKVVKQ